EGTSDLYKEVADWSNFNRIIEGVMPENVIGDVTIDNIKYHYLYDNARIDGYEGEPVTVIIPENIKIDNSEIPVTKVYEYAFDHCDSLTSILIPDNVAEIGERSFCGCLNLKKVKLGNNLKTIGREAFYNSESLEECDIPASVEELGFNAFLNTSIKKVTIPKNAHPQNELSVFGGMAGIDKFVVEEGNPFFREIDGALYRISENGIKLECVPGLKQGSLILPENCTTVWSNAITRVSGITEIIFNENLETIEREAVRAESIEHITMPKNAFVYSYAINSHSLKSVAFTGCLKNYSEIFFDCSELENIFIDSPEETVYLDGIFTDIKECINVFSSSPVKNFIYSEQCIVYVPGRAADNYAVTRATDLKEMWRYNVNRKDMKMEIIPEFEGVEIDKVTVNGKVVNSIDGVYLLSDANNIDVKVEYTLLGHQKMSTHYDSKFNEKVPDAIVSGIGETPNSQANLIDIYGIDGMLYKKGASIDDLKGFGPGIYILRQGNKSRKVVITK
ncbi:MAG: leucine-rich repeat domain-containing protein, partial [Muribaculaceae bacterium]|nr:leucine-rich repeat domain-containing protein [Muribaculaceae bacterium]